MKSEREKETRKNNGYDEMQTIMAQFHCDDKQSENKLNWHIEREREGKNR